MINIQLFLNRRIRLIVSRLLRRRSVIPEHRSGSRLLALAALGVAGLPIGCGASMPEPTQHLADEQSAERSAIELGAQRLPQAQLHLQLAHEQTEAARGEIRDGDNSSADRLLLRATTDAELAIALTREDLAKVEARKATSQSTNQRSTNAEQGARP